MFRKHIHRNSSNKQFLAHYKKKTQTKKESHASIISHGDHLLLVLIVIEYIHIDLLLHAKLVSDMVQQFDFNRNNTTPITKCESQKGAKGLLDQMCLQF